MLFHDFAYIEYSKDWTPLKRYTTFYKNSRLKNTGDFLILKNGNKIKYMGAIRKMSIAWIYYNSLI